MGSGAVRQPFQVFPAVPLLGSPNALVVGKTGISSLSRRLEVRVLFMHFRRSKAMFFEENVVQKDLPVSASWTCQFDLEASLEAITAHLEVILEADSEVILEVRQYRQYMQYRLKKYGSFLEKMGFGILGVHAGGQIRVHLGDHFGDQLGDQKGSFGDHLEGTI